MDWVKQYAEDADGMERGKKIEASGKQQRKDFLDRYPIESIPNLTIEQYVFGNNNSFSHYLRYGLCDIASMGNARPYFFEIYTKKDTGSQIHLSPSYQKFDSNEKAFIFLKNEIVNFLDDIKQENYANFEKYKINSMVKNMLMVVYFYDRFVPVCTNPAINMCLKSVNIPFKENAPMVDKNLALVKWKKTVPELADWSNQMVLDFCLWLNRKNIITNKDELVIEQAQKIETEISSLNLEGASKKAIINSRVNQGKFRDLLLKSYNKCCLCNIENPALLIASHIKPWAESGSKEKLDVNNGFLMCPNHDKLFDNGYIPFDDDGKIIISNKLIKSDWKSLNINNSMHIKLTKNNKKYLKFHRENVFNG